MKALILDFLPQKRDITTALLPSREDVRSVGIEAHAWSMSPARLSYTTRTNIPGRCRITVTACQAKRSLRLRSLHLQTLVPGERGASHGGLQIQGGDARTIEQVYDLPAVGD